MKLDAQTMLMAMAIQREHGGGGGDITTQSLSVSANGTYTAPSGKAYTPVNVNVPNTYAAGDEGKVVDQGALVAQTSKNINANGTHDTTKNNQVVVAVPNSYAAADEGKVVSNGALASQTSVTKTANGTYDTTTNNEVVVNVQPTLQSKTVTENGTVTADAGYDGLSSVTVNVSGGGGSNVLLMSNGQISTTSSYWTAYFDNTVDLTAYDALLFIIKENDTQVASGGTKYSGEVYVDFYCTGDLQYKMRLTQTNISCYEYSGAYRDLYVDVYGVLA